MGTAIPGLDEAMQGANRTELEAAVRKLVAYMVRRGAPGAGSPAAAEGIGVQLVLQAQQERALADMEKASDDMAQSSGVEWQAACGRWDAACVRMDGANRVLEAMRLAYGTKGTEGTEGTEGTQGQGMEGAGA